MPVLVRYVLACGTVLCSVCSLLDALRGPRVGVAPAYPMGHTKHLAVDCDLDCNDQGSISCTLNGKVATMPRKNWRESNTFCSFFPVI